MLTAKEALAKQKKALRPSPETEPERVPLDTVGAPPLDEIWWYDRVGNLRKSKVTDIVKEAQEILPVDEDLPRPTKKDLKEARKEERKRSAK